MSTETTTAQPGGPAGGGAADPGRPVRLHALTFLDEGDEVTVGRRDTDSYCALPADGAALLRELERGVTPRAAAEWYVSTYGCPVNMPEFLAAMDEMGFVAGETQEAAEAAPVRWQRLGRAMFSPIAWIAYAALLAAGAVVMTRNHALIPQYRNLFFTQYVTVITLLLVVGQLPFVVLHEIFHVLAGRRLGLRTRLRFDRRLYFVVIETTMDGLVSVPRRKRYLPIVAGMLADLLVLAALTLAAAVLRRPDGTEPVAGGICLALGFATMLRFTWQFYFYLGTDVTQGIVTVLGCVDLHKTTTRVIANRVNRVLRRHSHVTSESLMHPTDRRAARWYAWVLVGGYGLSLGMLVFIMLPAMIRIGRIVFGRLLNGAGTAGITDSAIFLAWNFVQLVMLAYIVIRNRRRRRHAPVTSHIID